MYNLVKDSVKFEISSEIFYWNIEYVLIENESVTINTFRNCECISLPKENLQEIGRDDRTISTIQK